MNLGFWGLAAGLAVVAADGAAADTIGPMVAEWQAGVVCPGEFGRGRDAADDLALIAQTQVVPAVLGIGFGIRARVAAPDGLGGVTVTVTHPPFAGSGTTQQTYSAALSGTVLSGFFYRLEDPEEVAPGAWRIVARQGDILLYDIDFRLVVPRPGDGLLRACGIG